jgi:signal transduction histidine kinase
MFLLCEAHGSIQQTETTLMKELVSPHDETVVHRCETKITKLGENTSLIVMRDISERHQRFEAEKKLIEEQTARRKDFEANRFTRHEVKNGLLAAIGLMDSIRENSANELSIRTTPTTISTSTHPVIMAGQNDLNVMEDDESDSGERTTNDVGTEAAEYSSGDSYSQSDVGDRYGELDNTLRDILDTIMDHAMSLDVINEEYKVRLEHVSVPEVLSNIRRQATRGPGQLRFSLVCSPLSFPILGLDSRLLRHIYQNALSNASRYGKPNGKIDTRVSYDQEKGEFKMVRRPFCIHLIRRVVFSHVAIPSCRR